MKDKQNVMMGDPVQCAELLNTFFQSQFQLGCMTGDFLKIQSDAQDSIDVTPERVANPVLCCINDLRICCRAS